MTRPLHTLACLVLTTIVCAQVDHIPDPMLRARLNVAHPGYVGPDGYIVNTEVVIDHWSDTVDWSPCDLSGLEYTKINEVSLLFTEGVELTTFNGFPNGVTNLWLSHYPGSSLPEFPASLLSINIDRPQHLIYCPAISGTLETPLIHLALTGFPADAPWPAIIDHVDQLQIQGCQQTYPPVLGGHIWQGAIEELPNLASLPVLVDGPSALEFGNLPAITSGWPEVTATTFGSITFYVMDNLETIGNLPPGLERLAIERCPVLTAMEIPPTLEGFSFGMMSDPGLPVLPTTLNSLTLYGLPNLQALPPLPPLLEFLSLSELQLTSVPTLPTTLTFFRLIALPDLAELPALPHGLTRLSVSQCDQVQCLPHLPATITSLMCDVACYPNTIPAYPNLTVCDLLVSNCPEDAPAITGHVFYDLNGDGVQQDNEIGAPHATISCQPTGHMTGTDGNGDYRLHLPMGTHDVHVSTLFNWATASIPAAYTVQLPEADTTVTGLDFAAAVGSATDRRIQATSLRPPRPGFDRTVRIDWEVASAIPAGSTIYLQTDPAETMVWSSIPPTSVDGTLYAWEIAPEDVVGTLLVSILTDASTPLGIWLHGIISIYPVEGDHDPVNNFAKLADDQVVGSYDPNDKQVFPAFLTPDEVASDTVVDYLVRFQNTGTYHAERVLITDTLSTDLRWETFRSVQSSHPCEWFLREGVAHFVFNDIMLPDSNANEPESHGFVRFKIRPRVGMVAGESITNVANIYFDFNEPVITEPCVLAVEIPTVVVEPPLAPVLVLFPVPVTQHVRVMMPDGPYRGQVLSADGRVVLQLGTVLNNASVDLGGLAPGQYVVQLHGENGLRMNARFMKQ